MPSSISTLPCSQTISTRSGGISTVGTVQAFEMCHIAPELSHPVISVSERNVSRGRRSASTDCSSPPVIHSVRSMSCTMVISTGSMSG